MGTFVPHVGKPVPNLREFNIACLLLGVKDSLMRETVTGSKLYDLNMLQITLIYCGLNRGMHGSPF